MKPTLLAIILLFGAARLLAASAAGSLFLLEEPSARARAAGGAWTAGEGGGEAMLYNPGGLAWQKGWEVDLSRANEADEWVHNWAAVSGSWMGTGLGLEYLNSSVPPVQIFDGLGQPLETENVGAQSVAVAASRSLFEDSLGVGLSLKGFQGALAGYNNLGMAMDLGAQYRFGFYPVVLGLSTQNFGWQTAYVNDADPLPQGVRMGLKTLVAQAAGLKLNASADYLRYSTVNSMDFLRGGAELSYRSLAFVSGGFQDSSQGMVYSFGGGISLMGVSLSYAAQAGYFPGLTQLVSLAYSPSSRLF